jgi:hypothetical protein
MDYSKTKLVSCLNTKDESQYWLYQQLSLCAELALFLSKPLAGGMLLKKNRLQIKVFITRACIYQYFMSINSFFNTVSVSRYSRPITVTRDPL